MYDFFLERRIRDSLEKDRLKQEANAKKKRDQENQEKINTKKSKSPNMPDMIVVLHEKLFPPLGKHKANKWKWWTIGIVTVSTIICAIVALRLIDPEEMTALQIANLKGFAFLCFTVITFNLMLLVYDFLASFKEARRNEE